MANDNRRWLYDSLTGKGVNVGTYEQFDSAINDENNLKWAYDAAGKNGLNVGDYDAFVGAMRQQTSDAKQETASPTATDAPAPAGTSSSRGRMSPGSRTSAFNERVRQREAARAGTATPATDLATEDWAQQVAASRGRRNAARQMPAGPSEPEPAQDAQPADDARAKAAEEARKRQEEVDALNAELEKYSETSDLVDEYERRLDENKNSLDPGSRKVRENNDWLYAHRDAYREAKSSKDMQEYNRIKRRIYDLTVSPALEDVNAKGEAINREIWDLNTGPANKEKTQRISELQDAKEIYNMAWQELKQGSKYDVGYEDGNGAGTAIGQFVGQAARNVDRGSFTLGLSEGLANKRARDIGDKYNAAINAAKDGLGYSDKDVDDLLKSINETGSGLEKVVGELEAEESSLNAMEATYKDMVKSGASQGDLAAYERQYNQKVKEYNKKVKEQYQPLRDRYDADKGKYDELMSAVDRSISDSLTPGEQEILNAYDALINARAVTADYASTAAKSGAGFEQTLEFMVDFWLTKGIDKAGTKVATKIARDRAIKKFGVEAVANMTVKPGIGLKMATDLGTSVARTAAMPTRFMQTAGEQLTQLDQTPYNGKDALGRYQFSRSKGNAYANAGVEDFIEYWSEGFGEYFGAAEAALFRNVTKAAPRTAIGQTLKSYRGSVGRYLDNAKFNGQFNETIEEVVGSGLNALTGWMSGDRLGDQEALNDFFKKDNLATLTVSFLPLSAIGAATNLNSYHQMKRRYNESVERLTPFIESGAISRKELEGLADNLKEMTPEQVKDRIVEMTDRAREANGGRLPQDFAKSIMGYLEGTFSMSLRNEEWEDSREKMAIVNAYTANYANPVARDAWDVNQNERTARNAALEAGFTEEDLDNDAWMLGQEAVETRLEGQEEKADVLMDYATAKAQAEGLRRGYAAQTAAMEEQYDANVRQNLDMNGTVTTATLNVDGKQTEVFIVQEDATVNPDGTVSTPTGDGVVAYRNTEKGAVRTAKADQFSNASATSTDSVIESANGALRQARETYFQSMQDTPSLKGQSEALANVVGQNVVIDDHEGVYQPVKVERLTEGGSRVVISGDKKAMQGIAERIGMRIPTTPYLEAPVERLFPLLSTEEDGSLTTFDPNPKEETRAAETTATANAQPAPAAQSEDLADQNVKAMVDGEVKDVHVLGVNEGRVMYEVLDENGNVVKTTNKTEADFARAMQEAQAPAVQEETPAPAAEENVPKQGTIPRDEKGRKVYDAEGVSVEDALEDLYNTPGLTEEKVDQYIADRAAKAEAARNPEMGDMTPEEWGAATMEANRVADFWSAMKQAAEARKAAPAPAPAQEQAPAREEKPAPKPRTAAPAPAGEPTRIDSRRKIVSKARDWQKRTKVKVHLVDSIEDVHDQEAREALEDGRALTGWFSKDTGEVEIYLPNITNTAVLDRTFVHEVVAHKGLEGLLGEEGYAALCDRVWNELMTPEEQQEFMNYNRHLRGTEEFLHRAAADEYIARLSENLDFPDNRSLFQKIVDWVMDILGIEGDIAGIEEGAKETAATETMDRTVLYALLEDSLKRYEAETTRGMRDAETKREIGADTGSAMETGEGNKGQTRFSMKSIVTGGGLNVLEDDGKGNVAFVTTDGRIFNADNPITADDLKGLGNTVMAHMMKDAREISHIDPQKEMRIWQAYADQLNAFLKKGVAKDGLDGADRLKALWQWEVENSVYRSVAPNSDEQYKYSLDITRVCKKNEATIKAISAMQRQLGYGITPGQVMDVYLSAIEEGYQVPCPVCYVFSRYINNGVVATIAINGQRRWGKDLVDPSTLTEEQRKERIAMWKKRLDEQEAFNETYKKQIAQAKKDCTDIIDEINRLSEQITSGKLKGKERAAAEKRVKLLDNRYRAAFDLVSQSALTQWIKQFAIRQTKSGYAPAKDGKKYDLWEDTFQGFPDEYALDLRLTAETIEKYPAIQRLRKARGAAGGKEIHFASNNDVGDIPMMLGADNSVNFYQKAVNARTQKERDYFLGKATERFKSAHKYAQQQSLRGGQRMWSWSDNIERLAPDVFVNLLQLQMLGGALQSYSKQLEGVNLVANMDGYVNGSLMGYGKGWTELKPEDVEYVEVNGEKVPVLSHDIKDVVEEKMPEGVVMRERYLAKKGAPVTMVDGKMVTLLFDDVVGIDAYGRDVDGKHLKGLFDLNGELDKAGNILVGMNDTHIIAAMADDRVFFIIPWHASGNSVHMVQQMLRGLGVDTMVKDYTDYTNVQEEKDMAGKKKGGEEAEFADEIEEVSKEEKIEETEPIRQEILDFWEDHKKEDEYRSGIGPIPSGKDGKLSDEQRRYRRLRDAIFDGTVADLSEEDRKAITDDAFLSQVLRKVNAVVDAKEMTAGDKKFIYPYEYWKENSTYDTADENGERYLEYCRRLGYKPKFVGKLDSRAKKDFGNFAGHKGYWKLLIDRRMYGVNGRFQDLDPVTTDRYDPRTVDPEWTAENFPLTTVADDPGAERIAARAIEKEGRTFKGGVPKPNYEGDIRSAARKYEMVSKLVDVKPGKGKNTMFRVADEMLNGEASADPQVSEGGSTMFRERTAPAPQNTKKVYKLMRLGEDGKLYPLFIDSANPIELKKWYDADSPDLSLLQKMPNGVFLVDYKNGTYTSIEDYKKERGEKVTKWPSVDDVNEATDNGLRWMSIQEAKSTNPRYKEKRLYDNIGINGSGSVETYAMRPGWHAGTLPTMRQIGLGPRDAKEKFRDDRFVWVEGYVPADVDYNEEAQGNPGQDIPTHIPENGYYKKATNANKKASQADKVDWYVAGSFYADRIIGDREARQVIDDYNNAPENKGKPKVAYDWPRYNGRVFNAETMSLEDENPEPDGPNGGGTRFREVSSDLYDRYENQNGEDKPWMSEGELIDRIEEELPYGLETKELFAKIDEYRRLDEEDFNEGRRDFSGSERDNVFQEILSSLKKLSEGESAGTRFREGYHGSTADFDRFDLSHALEGEGYASHGFGHYIAFNKDTGLGYAWNNAFDYADRNGLIEPNVAETLRNDEFEDYDSMVSRYDELLEKRKQDIAKELEEARKDEPADESIIRSLEEDNRKIQGYRPLSEVFDGMRNIYTVEVPDDNGNNYIDEDKPLSEDGRKRIADVVRNIPEIRKEADAIEQKPYTALELRRILETGLGNMGEARKKVSEIFRDAGFVGIKYDGKTDGPCAVIFDDNDLKIKGHTRFREEVNRDAARVKETVNERAHDLSANRGLGFIKQDVADGKVVTKKDPGITLRLGLPSGSLLAGGVRNQPMVVSEYDLMEASGNGYGDAHHYHPYDLGDLNDLATLINHPVAVFRDKRNPYNRVLLLDRKGRITGREQSRKFDYVAAIASVPVYDANGKRSFVNRILTVFPAESKWKEFYAQLKDLADGNAEVGQDVMWVDNKKISSWVKGHSTSVGAYDTITREDVANIQKSFEDKQDFLRIDAESRQQGGNTRFRESVVTPEQDAEYMDAVNAGDMEKAGQMVRDAFKAAFPDTKVVDENGDPRVMYHGTKEVFNTFKTGTKGTRFAMGIPYEVESQGFFFSASADNAGEYGRQQSKGDKRSRIVRAFLNMRNPADLSTLTSESENLFKDIVGQYPVEYNPLENETTDWWQIADKEGTEYDIDLQTRLKELGYDGIIFAEKDGNKSYFVLSSNQIKSAEPVTYDDAGNVIPLSERFNPENPDIRFREADSGNAAVDYENEIRRTTTKILLEFQDADIPVRVAVNKIMNEVSKEHLDESEDYLTRHNLVSSRADAQMHKFKLFYYGPLMDTVGEIEDRLIERTSDDKPGKRARKAAYERIRNYIYAVSALERNAWKNDEADKNRKDALDDIEVQRRKKAEDVEADSRLSRDEKDIAIEEVEKWAKKKRSEARRKYARRDWSGITALMGRPKDEWVEAEADATDMVSTFRTELGDEDMLKKLWDGIRACTDFNLEFAYKNGLLTRTEYERFHGTESQPRMWEYYVPLRGFAERTAEDEYSYNMLTNRDTKDTVLKDMKGRVTQADDPIANIRHIAEMGIVQGLNNWAKRALYEFVIDAGKNTLLTPVDYWYIKDDDGNWSPAEPEEDESLEHFEERMVGLMNEDEPRARKGRNGLKLSLLMGNKGHRNAHMIRLKVNGVDKGIWVNGDPVLAKAVNGAPGWNHRVIRGVQKVNRNLAQLYTTLSVKFITKNKMRDTQFSRIAALVGEDQAYLSALEKNWWANNGYVAAAAPMMKMVFDWESGKLEKKENLTEREQMFIDFMYDGGATGYTVMNTMEDIKKDLEKMVENAGSEQRTLPVIGLYAKWVGALNEGAELLTRFTFYQTSRQMGRSRERAAYDAKESSVNFNRRGLRSGEGVIGFAAAATGLLYLFFNPAVQGLDKFVRLHKEQPWKMGIVDATYFMMGFVNSMLNAMIAGASDGGGGDDDDKMGPDWYWNIPEWVRRSNIIIGSPFKKLGKWGYLVISLPIEYKGFYAMGELASSLLQKRYAARDAATIANEVVGVVAELLPVNPVEGYTPGDNAAMSVLRNLTPGALAPIVDVATNRSFSGVPLWKENIYDETQPLSQSSFASTPEILNKAVIKLSDATATMPWHIDIPAGAVRGLLKGYGGGAYTFVEDLGKFVFADEAHPRRYENFPIVSGFTGYLEEDRRNSFNNNALQNYKELSKDVVTRIRSVAPEVDEKMVYEHPDDLPPKAKVAMVALKDKWILGQMYYNGIKERSGAMESRVNKRGDVYSASVDDSVKGLRSVWKKKKEEYAKLLEDKNADDQELETARDAMLDAWSAYTDAEDSLVDKLLEEEYYHVQERLKNGIPYEPKRTLGEKAYDLTNKKK